MLLSTGWLAHIVTRLNISEYNNAHTVLSERPTGRFLKRVGGIPNIRAKTIFEPAHVIMVLFVLRKLILQTRRLAWAVAGRLCNKYHNLMSWLIPTGTSNRTLPQKSGRDSKKSR